MTTVEETRLLNNWNLVIWYKNALADGPITLVDLYHDFTSNTWLLKSTGLVSGESESRVLDEVLDLFQEIVSSDFKRMLDPAEPVPQGVHCEMRRQIVALFGREAACTPSDCCTEHPCTWAGPCPACGMPRVNAYDPCHGWMELCLNRACGRDK
jgi:hypothetical protein